MDVSIVLVTHNTKELVDKCLNSISKQTATLEFETIVVDNGSTDGTLDFLKVNYPNVIIVRNEISYGFGHGVNSGAKVAKGKHIFILEADTELLSTDAIQKLSDFLDSNSNCAAVYPQLILSKNKEVQRSVFISFPNLLTFLFEWLPVNLFMGYFFKKFDYIGKYYFTREQLLISRKVAWGMGGIVMLKKHVFKMVGGMDQRFFLLWEDTDLFKMISDQKFEMWFNADVQVLHHWGANFDNMTNTITWYRSSLKKYMLKHYSYIQYILTNIILVISSTVSVFFLSLIIPLVKAKKGDIIGIRNYQLAFLKSFI